MAEYLSRDQGGVRRRKRRKRRGRSRIRRSRRKEKEREVKENTYSKDSDFLRESFDSFERTMTEDRRDVVVSRFELNERIFKLPFEPGNLPLLHYILPML